MNCTDYGAWLFNLLLIVNMLYIVLSSHSLRKQSKELEDRIRKIERE